MNTVTNIAVQDVDGVVPEPIGAVVPVEHATVVTQPARRWSLPTRIAFRFCALYFTLYILTTQMFFGLFQLPWGRLPSPEANQTLRNYVTWIHTKWLGLPVFNGPSGSGDKPYDWGHAVALLTIAATVVLVWSAVDWKRQSYVGVNKWFRLFLRFGLASTMLSYGMAKAFPLQMSYPPFTRLLEPYGNFSPMGVLWAQIGASPSYEIFTGCAELTAAILLFIPGLTTIGALFAVAVAGQVFTLNMTYDVPVKLFSFHLVLMSLVLLAPDVCRLVTFLVLKRPTDPPKERPLAKSRIGQRIAVVSQLVVAGWLVYGEFTGAQASYRQTGPSAPKPPLYGIWTIDKMTIDGVERSPLVTDYDRWRRLVIQRAGSVSFQRMDDTFAGYQVKVDMDAKTLVVTRPAPRPAGAPPIQPGEGAQIPPVTIGTLAIEQPAPDRLVLDGILENKKLRMETTLFDHRNFMLVKTGFKWVQNLPLNR